MDRGGHDGPTDADRRPAPEGDTAEENEMGAHTIVRVTRVASSGCVSSIE